MQCTYTSDINFNIRFFPGMSFCYFVSYVYLKIYFPNLTSDLDKWANWTFIVHPFTATSPSIMDHEKRMRTVDITTIYQATCHKISNLHPGHLWGNLVVNVRGITIIKMPIGIVRPVSHLTVYNAAPTFRQIWQPSRF